MLSLASDLVETVSTSAKGAIDRADGRFDGSNPFGKVRLVSSLGLGRGRPTPTGFGFSLIADVKE